VCLGLVPQIPSFEHGPHGQSKGHLVRLDAYLRSKFASDIGGLLDFLPKTAVASKQVIVGYSGSNMQTNDQIVCLKLFCLCIRQIHASKIKLLKDFEDFGYFTFAVLHLEIVVHLNRPNPLTEGQD